MGEGAGAIGGAGVLLPQTGLELKSNNLGSNCDDVGRLYLSRVIMFIFRKVPGNVRTYQTSPILCVHIKDVPYHGSLGSETSDGSEKTGRKGFIHICVFVTMSARCGKGVYVHDQFVLTKCEHYLSVNPS